MLRNPGTEDTNMMTEEKTIDELEEEAVDGNEEAARQLYEMFRDSDPERAAYWHSMIKETPHMEDEQDTEEEAAISAGSSESTVFALWHQDYVSGTAARLPVRELMSRMNDGDPFSALILGDMFEEERLRFYSAAEKNLEAHASDASIGKILYRLNISLGDLYRNMKTGNLTENRALAFRYYSNAAELRASEEDEHRFDRLIDCYQNGIGCTADPNKARELMKKRAYVSGPEVMLAMADEYARTGSRIEEAEMLQQCDASAGENDLLCKAAARFRLSEYGMPGADGAVPSAVQEILNIASYRPDQDTLQKYMNSSMLAEFLSKADSLLDNASLDREHINDIALMHIRCVHPVNMDAYNEYLRCCRIAAEAGFAEAEEKQRAVIKDIEAGYPGQNDAENIRKADILTEYYRGIQDDTSAFRWMLESVSAGKKISSEELRQIQEQAQTFSQSEFPFPAHICNMLVKLYEWTDDKEQAFIWSARGAVQEDPEAQYQYAFLLKETGKGDPQEIFRLMLSSAKNGYTPAYEKTAEFYEEGYGTEQDLNAAENWYTQAISSGAAVWKRLAELMIRLGMKVEAVNVLDRMPEKDDETYTLMADLCEELGNPGRAESLISVPANRGYVPAMLKFAQIGRAHGKPGMCANWYRRAAEEQSDPEGMLHYAECLQDGYGVPSDLSKALQYYMKAAAEGVKEAYYPIAQLFESGKASDSDRSRCLAWYVKAANSGNADAMYKVGMMCLEGVYADQNTELALKWLELAADAGSVSALEELGDLWSAGSQPEENYSKAINYLVAATKKGSDRAMYLLGRTYAKPTSFQDLALARSCYETAAYAEDMDAIRALADMYSKGIGGEKDSRKAAELRTKILADDGSRIAENAVAKGQQIYEQVIAKGNEGVDMVLDKVNDFLDDDQHNNDGVAGWLKGIGRKLKG